MASPNYSWCEGFGTLGPVGTSGAALLATLLTQRWSQGTFNGTGDMTLVEPLAGSGNAAILIQTYDGNLGASFLTKVLPGTYARTMGGFCFSISQFIGTQGIASFGYSGTAQVTISLNALNQLVVTSGANSWTSARTFATNGVYWIAYDITFSTTGGAIKIYINGALDANLNLSGVNTSPAGTADVFNTFTLELNGFYGSGVTGYVVFDHVWEWCYTSATTSDTPLTNNVVVISNPPNSDVSVQFTPIQIGGYIAPINVNNPALPANQLNLRQFTAPVSGTVSAIDFYEGAASGADVIPCIYADNGSSAPAALLGSGAAYAVATGVNSAPLSAGVAVVQGTKYWIGFLSSTAWNPASNANTTSATSGEAAVTYTSGAPATAPTMTMGQSDLAFWVDVTSSGHNYPQVSANPPNTTWEFNQSETVGAEDLFGFPALPSWVGEVYWISVGINAVIDTSGARTVNVVGKSGTVSSNGSMSGFAPGATAVSFYSDYLEDPNTSAAWAVAAANAFQAGYEIAS